MTGMTVQHPEITVHDAGIRVQHPGIAVQLPPKSAFTFLRNRCSRSAEIRTQRRRGSVKSGRTFANSGRSSFNWWTNPTCIRSPPTRRRRAGGSGARFGGAQFADVGPDEGRGELDPARGDPRGPPRPRRRRNRPTRSSASAATRSTSGSRPPAPRPASRAAGPRTAAAAGWPSSSPPAGPRRTPFSSPAAGRPPRWSSAMPRPSPPATAASADTCAERRDQDRPRQAHEATPLACISTRMLSVP